MSLASTQAWANNRLNLQLVDAAHVDRPVGEPAWDPNTEQTVQQYERIYTARRCKFKADATDLRYIDAAETEILLSDRTVVFEHPTDVRVDDVVTVAAAKDNTLDIGQTYEVRVIDRRTRQIGRVAGIREQHVPILNETP